MKKYQQLIIAICYAIFLVFLRLPFWQSIDEKIALFFISQRLDNMTLFFDIFTHLADSLSIIILTGLLILIFAVKRQYDWAALLLMITGCSAVLNKILKTVIARARPTFSPLHIETSYSFPSGHSCAIMALCGFLIYYTIKNQTIPWIKNVCILSLSSIILLIGISRLYLSVHWFTDVIAGFSTGLFILYISIFYFQQYRKKRGQH